MSRFLDVGVQIQQEARTIRAAERKFEHSCEICCSRGYAYNCDTCPIAAEHESRVTLLRYAEMDEQNMD